MPTVQIEMFEGRTLEQKKLLVQKVTQAIVESVNTAPENVKIIIRDMSKENFATAGKLAIEE
ncbi:MAG: 2-hydroxymuconate tautomerase [Candidatus Dichloromethanomonas elyunquensis]|nr:MAG: 2-hydroxymuconate tautomerase [Candidatus Dichloromethanomonas elyunquensis]